ncbi:hypothetical protein KP509_20G050000 [Ceratopteris richardii]|uniref:Uncharacterized protein n=1 Tax=Ceratopteris richardii TaxID=49495 RepID=A0A8T2SF62_CERRI|nr:hypothetical protein KP509_20G050000 [Ceratopteris richardii]
MRNIFRSRKRSTSKIRSASTAALQHIEQIVQRHEFIEKKICKLDAELLSLGEQIKKARPGPTQGALKDHALIVLKQKRRYEAQKVMLEGQKGKLERALSAAAEELHMQKKPAMKWLLCLEPWCLCR